MASGCRVLSSLPVAGEDGRRFKLESMSTLEDLFGEFACRQQELIRSFLPIAGTAFGGMARFKLSPVERMVAVRRLRELGYGARISEEDDRLCIVTTDDDDGQSKPGQRRGIQGCPCATLKSWNAAAEQFAFEWLFASLNCRTAHQDQSDPPQHFEIFIPLLYDSRFICSPESCLAQRQKIFARPIKWANALSRFTVCLDGCCRLRVQLKADDELEKARLRAGALIFASLSCVQRVRDPLKPDWLGFPSTAMEIVLRFLIK